MFYPVLKATLPSIEQLELLFPCLQVQQLEADGPKNALWTYPEEQCQMTTFLYKVLIVFLTIKHVCRVENLENTD